jgi:hypothetical protein
MMMTKAIFSQAEKLNGKFTSKAVETNLLIIKMTCRFSLYFNKKYE